MPTAIYLCRTCWEVAPASPDLVWMHRCTGRRTEGGGHLQMFRWEDRTDFQYLHNQEELLLTKCPCCNGTGHTTEPHRRT